MYSACPRQSDFGKKAGMEIRYAGRDWQAHHGKKAGVEVRPLGRQILGRSYEAPAAQEGKKPVMKTGVRVEPVILRGELSVLNVSHWRPI